MGAARAGGVCPGGVFALFGFFPFIEHTIQAVGSSSSTTMDWSSAVKEDKQD